MLDLSTDHNILQDTITNRLPAIQRMINEGHQIGSHTYVVQLWAC